MRHTTYSILSNLGINTNNIKVSSASCNQTYYTLADGTWGTLNLSPGKERDSYKLTVWNNKEAKHITLKSWNVKAPIRRW